MAPFDDWNKIDEDEEEELQDSSVRSIRATSGRHGITEYWLLSAV